MKLFKSILAAEYGIQATHIDPTPGGFSAQAYRVRAGDSDTFFLKVYNNTLPTTRFFVDRIDVYMPVLHRLSRLPALESRVLTPVPARGGAYRVWAGRFTLILFHFVAGTVPGIGGMSHSQTVQLGRLLAALHTATVEAPGLAEELSLPFLERLEALCQTIAPGDALYSLVAPYRRLLAAAIRETRRLLESARLGHTPLVLCHGDAHGGNVIQSGQLVLADWEDLRLAPAEADLFIYAWHPHGHALLEAYRAARPGFCIHAGLLRFYVLRRRLEDVWVDIQRYTEEAPGEAEAVALLAWIKQGLAALADACHGTPEK